MTISIAPKSYHPIHRQNGSSSKQPRFDQVSPRSFFRSIFNFYKSDVQGEPEYGTQERDTWLRTVWKLEPYMAGVINSVTNIDKNRGWSLIGGRNQVKRFSDILHNNFHYAPDLSGWRTSFGGSALSYYTSDLGSITEIGRLNSEQGPLDSLYFVDPAQCYLTGSFSEPLAYKPSRNAKIQYWKRDDYFRVVSLPSTDENLYGLGFCALSRAIELLKIMVGIYQYDNEMLLNRAPRGLMLLKGITQDQWEDAMTSREARLDGDEKRYYGAVNVLATLDPGVEIEAQLVALSQLPAEFDQKVFTDLLMYGYALIFGYDPREFWPVSAGSLGTATETEAQHRKGGAKGGLDFVLGFAEKLQAELPDTLQFQFEERDLDGELANSEADKAKADVTLALYDKGQGLITLDEGRILLVQDGLIDDDWTLEQEETIATDTETIRSSETIQRAIFEYPDEPIVKCERMVIYGKDIIVTRTLLPASRITPRSFIVNRSITRQIDTQLLDYQTRIEELSRQAVDGDISQVEYQEQLDNLTIAMLTLSMLRGLDAQSDTAELLDNAATILLDNPYDTEALAMITDEGLLSEVIPPMGIEELNTLIDYSLNSDIANIIYGGYYDLRSNTLIQRLTMWTNSARGLHTLGILLGDDTQNYIFEIGNAIEHCASCERLNGQVHSGKEWAESRLYPQSRQLDCEGYNCQCRIRKTTLDKRGSLV